LHGKRTHLCCEGSQSVPCPRSGFFPLLPWRRSISHVRRANGHRVVSRWLLAFSRTRCPGQRIDPGRRRPL
jgi:hypothetical protein